MRRALLACVLSGVASAQLPESTTWKYSVVSGGGYSGRFLLFMDAPPSTTRRAREWWTLETGAVTDDGSVPLTRTVRNAEGQSKTLFKTWSSERGVVIAGSVSSRAQALPMVTRDSPPRVLSMERVPCTASFLGGVGATCAGRAGGPLNQPELPLLVQVQADTDRSGRTLAALGAFILSAGVILPGTDDRSIVARLELKPSPLPPALAAWKKSAHTVAALEKLQLGDDAETLGAVLVLGGTPKLDVVHALTKRAPMLDRWPLIRLARQSGIDARSTVQLIARLATAHELESQQHELRASVLVGLSPSLTTAIDSMLADGMPTLRTIAASSKQFDVDAAKALETATLQPGEGVAFAHLMTKPALDKALPRFIERLTDAEGLVIVDGLVRDDANARRLTVLQKLPAWVDRVLQHEQGAELVRSLSFDNDRMKLLQGSWRRAPADAHVRLLKLAVASFSFDPQRVELLRAWLPQTPLTLADCRAMLDDFTSDESRDIAGRLMLPNLPENERGALVVSWLQKTRESAVRLKTLQELSPTLSLDEARAVYDAVSFDDDKAKCANAMLPLVPETDRAEFFVHCVKHMSFDEGRLTLLNSPSRPKLNDEQRYRVIDAFAFERGKAATLLR